MSSTPAFEQPETQRSRLFAAIVIGAIVALAAADFYLYSQIGGVRTDLSAGLSKMHAQMTGDAASLREASSASATAEQRQFESLKQELATARNQARTLSSQAKMEATARAEELAHQLQSAQAKASEQLTGEISGVRQSAESAHARIADVSMDVGSVKTDLGSTRTELQKTIAELKSVRGDLGVQSGLIATNASELAALKRLGERNYFEFKLGKSKTPQRVADVTLRLRSADPKHNRYAVDVMAGDKLTEKKNKSINEPVQFYTAKFRQPYELVINQVEKNLIVGYLSTPKEEAAR